MQEITRLVRVEEVLHEPSGYITYVFETLENRDRDFLQSNYIMCIRYPNWDHRSLRIGEEGFLCYRNIQEGIDKYFDGKSMIPYNQTSIQFMKFVPKRKQYECIMD